MARKRRSRRLTEEDRQRTLKLHEEGVSFREIAKRLKCSVGSVSNMLSGGVRVARVSAVLRRLNALVRENLDTQAAVRYHTTINVLEAAIEALRDDLALDEYLRERAELERLVNRLPDDDLARPDIVGAMIERYLDVRGGK